MHFKEAAAIPPQSGSIMPSAETSAMLICPTQLSMVYKTQVGSSSVSIAVAADVLPRNVHQTGNQVSERAGPWLSSSSGY